MASKLKWNGKQFAAVLSRATADGLVRAGTFYHAKCREAVSKPNTGVRRRGKGGRFAKTLYPNPSKPGEPPRLRTGFGQRNIVVNHNRKEMWTRVGVTKNGLYMIFLELGTRRVARRPWLVATLRDNHSMISKLAATGKTT